MNEGGRERDMPFTHSPSALLCVHSPFSKRVKNSFIHNLPHHYCKFVILYICTRFDDSSSEWMIAAIGIGRKKHFIGQFIVNTVDESVERIIPA